MSRTLLQHHCFQHHSVCLQVTLYAPQLHSCSAPCLPRTGLQGTSHVSLLFTSPLQQVTFHH